MVVVNDSVDLVPLLEGVHVVVVFVTMISIVYRYRSILAFPLEFIGHILKHLVITNHYT